MNILSGFLLGAVIGVVSWKLRALSPSGAAAAAVTGGIIFGIGGLSWAVLLLTFFISSSLLSKVAKSRKAALNEKFAKGSVRDWGQVLANGGLGALLALASTVLADSSWIWAAFGGAMAAVNADTWSTELGVLSRSAPRLITNGRTVEPGTSGAVSPLGLLAALAGAGLIALAGSFFLPPSGSRMVFFFSALIGGTAGSLFDSLLGATVQAIYYCPNCKKETERHPTHLCGCETVYRRGWRWLNNDAVNFACSLAGAGAAAGLSMLF